jgi:magnesium transporter
LIYFRDLYDHMFRIAESIDVERDLATSTMEAYLSVVANRTNEIMKVLTIFSSILLPVNLVAGIYGMNFEMMPELKWKFGYGWALGLMASIVILMLLWFWRFGWLGMRRRDVIRRERLLRKKLGKGITRNRPQERA